MSHLMRRTFCLALERRAKSASHSVLWRANVSGLKIWVGLLAVFLSVFMASVEKSE